MFIPILIAVDFRGICAIANEEPDWVKKNLVIANKESGYMVKRIGLWGKESDYEKNTIRTTRVLSGLIYPRWISGL